MNQIICLIIALTYNVISFSQSNYYTLSKEAENKIEKRAIDLDKSIFLGDSLYNIFKTEGVDKSFDTDYLALIHRLYLQAENFGCKDNKIIKRKDELLDVLKAWQISYSEEQYQKVIDKAEELFLEKKYEKAYELYSRALVFKPSEKSNKKKLKKLKKLIKKS